MKFLMFIKSAEGHRHDQIPDALNEAMGKFVEDGFKRGIIKDTQGLKPSANGWRIRSKGGKLHVTDGPFSEAKEVIGGYAFVETATEQEARDLAWQFMELHRIHWPEFECESECRPLDGQ